MQRAGFGWRVWLYFDIALVLLSLLCSSWAAECAANLPPQCLWLYLVVPKPSARLFCDKESPFPVGDLVTQGHLGDRVSKDRATAVPDGSAAAELSVPGPVLPAPWGTGVVKINTAVFKINTAVILIYFFPEIKPYRGFICLLV